MFEGILIAAITPFRHQKVDEKALAVNLQKWNETDVAGYLFLGSTGEFALLKLEEKVQVLRAARQFIPKDKIMMAGIGCESVEETVYLGEQAAEIGVDAVLVLSPHYYKTSLTPEVLRRYFLQVSERVALPLYLYNIPQFTGVNLGIELIRELAEHPRIAGIKDSSGNLALLYDLLQMRDRLNIFVGSLFAAVPAWMMGAHGSILAFANAPAAEICEVYRIARAGKQGEAMEKMLRIIRLGRRTLDRYGIPGLKHLMGVMGYDPGEPRLPFVPVSAEAAADIEAAYREFLA